MSTTIIFLPEKLKGFSFAECKTNMRGKNYAGKISKTGTGKICQRWDTQTPKRHTVGTDPRNFPEDSLPDASNYCRNPDNSPPGPWCYLVQAEKRPRWEPCSVPACGKKLITILIFLTFVTSKRDNHLYFGCLQSVKKTGVVEDILVQSQYRNLGKPAKDGIPSLLINTSGTTQICSLRKT